MIRALFLSSSPETRLMLLSTQLGAYVRDEQLTLAVRESLPPTELAAFNVLVRFFRARSDA